MTDELPFLAELNASQRKAVTSPAKGAIQIIAGPGTGKTKVLTSRVAYLLLKAQIPPESIIVTTFTKKAANEMKDRLNLILKDTNIRTSKLLMGTFHSICLRVLKRYGNLIGVVGFSIASEKDSLDVISGVIERNEKELDEIRDMYQRGELPTKETIDFTGKGKQKFSPGKYRSFISSLKSKGLSADDFSSQLHHNRELSLVFNDYEKKMKVLNMLDFDDLLLHTNNLLKEHKCMKHIDHVLIDEFQDTNTVQLELMRGFSRQNLVNPDNVTVVGDPDQSIYAFRDAEVKNFNLMRNIYSQCEIIQLTQNYRSTKHVLDFSEELMLQQNARASKQLSSHLLHTFPPVFQEFSSLDAEANYIATEIKFLKSLPGLYNYSDFSILVRAAHLTRPIEKALIQNKVPYNVLKGRAFWERKEVSLLIDFLRVIANANDVRAIIRVVAEFTTGIGAKGISVLSNVLESKLVEGITPLDSIAGIVNGSTNVPGKVAKKSLKLFLETIDGALEAYGNLPDTVLSISNLFDYIISLEGFQKVIENSEEKVDNLEEVRKLILEFEEPEEEESLGFDDDDEVIEVIEETLLQKFLVSVNLYLTGVSKDEEDLQGKVSISTIHASKGLEWPIVFVPGLSNSTLPSARAGTEMEVDEERRIFYVSTTRAKHLLYITYGIRWESELSRFITTGLRKITSDSQLALMSSTNINKLYDIAAIPVPDAPETIVARYKTFNAGRVSTDRTSNQEYHQNQLQNHNYYRKSPAATFKEEQCYKPEVYVPLYAPNFQTARKLNTLPGENSYMEQPPPTQNPVQTVIARTPGCNSKLSSVIGDKNLKGKNSISGTSFRSTTRGSAVITINSAPIGSMASNPRVISGTSSGNAEATVRKDVLASTSVNIPDQTSKRNLLVMKTESTEGAIKRKKTLGVRRRRA